MSKKRGKYGQGRVYQPKYKAADGTVKTVNKWYVQYYDKAGNQRREATAATTEKEARAILTGKLYDVEQGTVSAVDFKTLRYGDLRSAILAHFGATKKRSLEILTGTGERTVRGLTKLDEFFGYKGESDKGLKVSAMNDTDWISGFIEARRKEGVSDGTIRNSGKLLRQMIKHAVNTKKISLAQAPTFTLPPAPEAKEDFATKEQFDKLLTVLAPRFHPYATWLFYQATRKVEAAETTWGQIDLASATFFPDAAKNKTRDTDPKPLADDVVKALKTVGPGEPDELVFSSHSQKAFQKAFRRASLKAGLGRFAWQCSQCKAIKDAPAPKATDPAIVCEACKKMSKGVHVIPMQFHYVGLTIHGLRRSTVVYYRQAGLADAEIMKITGHKTTKTFMGYNPVSDVSIRKRLHSAASERERLQRLQQGPRKLLSA